MTEADQINKLLEQLNTHDWFKAVPVMDRLVEIGEPAVPQLLSLLRSPDTATSYALNILGRLRVNDALPLIDTLLLSEDFTVREQAIVALGRIKPPDLEEKLRFILKTDSIADVRATAAYTLRLIDSPDVVRLLIETLAAKSSIIVEAASDALIEIGNTSLPLLVEAFTTAPDEEIRGQVHITLSLIVEEFDRHRFSGSNIDQDLLKMLLQPLKASNDITVRDFVKWALGELKATQSS